jgi:hypothetical protein
MLLIREMNEDVQQIIEEVGGGKKNHYIEGIFLQSEIKNKNGRLYPESVMDKEVNRYIKESIEAQAAWGELDHPDKFNVSMKNVSHRIISLKKEGTNWVGKAIITDTPMGNIAKGLMESGGKLAVSSRALGSLKLNNEGTNIVQNDFRLSTAADIVGDPSAPSAWVNGIMENVEYFYDEKAGIYVQAEKAKKIISKLSTKQIAENQAKLFEQFINSIK